MSNTGSNKQKEMNYVIGLWKDTHILKFGKNFSVIYSRKAYQGQHFVLRKILEGNMNRDVKLLILSLRSSSETIFLQKRFKPVESILCQ